MDERPATIKDWLSLPEGVRAELIDGRIIYQSMPGLKHGRSQGRIFSRISSAYDGQKGRGGQPGGWWLSQEVDIEISGQGCRPDVVGWRRDRFPTMPEENREGVVTDVPDFICEVLSPSTAHVDQGKKRTAYHRAGVGHYWLIDPIYKTLMVLVRDTRDYFMCQIAGPDETVRPEPFEEIDISISWLFEG